VVVCILQEIFANRKPNRDPMGAIGVAIAGSRDFPMRAGHATGVTSTGLYGNRIATRIATSISGVNTPYEAPFPWLL
jgi:hypothetical protein